MGVFESADELMLMHTLADRSRGMILILITEGSQHQCKDNLEKRPHGERSGLSKYGWARVDDCSS
jgi:hypothetical protein